MDRVYEETVQEKDKQIEVLKVHSVAAGICSLFFLIICRIINTVK